MLEADAEADAPEPDATSDDFPARPDLVLIDGGRGQLAVAREVLDALGITDIALVGVAKGPDRDAGREHFHFPGRDKPLLLEPRDPVLYFVQRLRDEAHRFVIGTHRAKRSKAIGANPLDEIAGIGPGRKRALLEHFGSAKAVSRASPDDLRAIDGISAANGAGHLRLLPRAAGVGGTVIAAPAGRRSPEFLRQLIPQNIRSPPRGR